MDRNLDGAANTRRATRHALMLEKLEPRILFAADPVATVTAPTDGVDPFINENFQFSVGFDNASGTASDIGFGPYFDLVAPVEIDVQSASYLGSTVNLRETGYWDSANTRWLDKPVGDPTAMPLTEHHPRAKHPPTHRCLGQRYLVSGGAAVWQLCSRSTGAVVDFYRDHR